MLSRSVQFICLGLLLGCSSGETQPKPPSRPEPTIQVGTGRRQFVAIGEEVELIRGPQDGYHVWVSARAYNWDPGVESILDVQLETRWLGVPESEVSGSGLVSALLGVDEAGVEIRDMLGWPAAIHRPQCAHGQVLSVRVSFLPVWEQGASSGAPGTMWTGEITARVNVPEDYRLRDCL